MSALYLEEYLAEKGAPVVGTLDTIPESAFPALYLLRVDHQPDTVFIDGVAYQLSPKHADAALTKQAS
jgi:hypothetical protein